MLFFSYLWSKANNLWVADTSSVIVEKMSVYLLLLICLQESGILLFLHHGVFSFAL
jgi:hypothetical protein